MIRDPRAETVSQTSRAVIRQAKAEDVPQIVQLVRATLEEFGLRFGEGSETDAQVLALPESYAQLGGQFWVAVEDRSVLGTAGVAPLGDGTFELRKMYVGSCARGQRIGQRLLEYAVSWVREQGGARIVLDTVENMRSAIAFYEANRFIRDDRHIRGARCTRGYVLEL